MKHLHSPPFISKKTFKLLLNERSFFFEGLRAGLLPLFLDPLPFKFIVICPSTLISSVAGDLSLYLDERGVFYGESVYKKQGGLLGGYEQERISLFNSSLESCFKNKDFILTTKEGLFSKTIQKQEPQKEVLVNCFSTHAGVVSSLMTLGYKRVDFVRGGGDFAERGCVVDFFPKESLFAVRVLFEKKALVFSFDPRTQLTTRELPSFVLLKSKSLDFLVSLQDEVSRDFKYLYLDTNGVSFFKKNADKKVELKIKYLSPYQCLEQKERSLFANKCFGGFVYKKEAFVPDWLDRKTPLSQKITGDAYVDFSSLEKGDFLIHEDFGVGEYLGLSDQEGEDFLVLKYKGAQIKVFPSFFDKISMFKKAEEDCSLDVVGKGSSWGRRVLSTKKQLSLFVESLFESYLQRQVGVCRSYYIDPEIESSFLRGFPHTDTFDQKKSWDEIKKDLCSSSPMERLLCGDVGFGKTEIAMRAAFLTAINGGGVLVAAPTAVLAKQLFLSFSERLEGFGVRVAFLSRFVSFKDSKKFVDLFINKKIDVLVGTHVVMNKESCLKRASLLIVDDEHKFGVTQKSRVKSLKTNVNLLYMSATPIPRTLNLALSKFSNISLISTPPPLKIPPKTYVDPYDFSIIKRALTFEFSRGGQSFFIHNKIKTMPAVVSKIKREMPFLVVDFIHAKETPAVIEKKMDLFINKKIDVLVASTILENGINIKNVNTVIINNAQLFGVSQLYQIRGRVGRGGKQSFSYLLYPKRATLSPLAKRRLNIIKNNSSLGSCYSVAMEDLKSRGAGAVFGHKQSGGINSVGLELYGKLLAEASSKEKSTDFSSSHSLPSFIPKEYLPSSKLRVWGYKEISLLKNEGDVEGFIKKLTNMFGPLPAALENLLFVKHLEVLGLQGGIKKIVQKKTGVELFLYKDVWENRVSFLVDVLKDVVFNFLDGGGGVFIKVPFDNNFILILKKICARLQCEK